MISHFHDVGYGFLASAVPGDASHLFSTFLPLADTITFLPYRNHLLGALEACFCVSGSGSLLNGKKVENNIQMLMSL